MSNINMCMCFELVIFFASRPENKKASDTDIIMSAGFGIIEVS